AEAAAPLAEPAAASLAVGVADASDDRDDQPWRGDLAVARPGAFRRRIGERGAASPPACQLFHHRSVLLAGDAAPKRSRRRVCPCLRDHGPYEPARGADRPG